MMSSKQNLPPLWLSVTAASFMLLLPLSGGAQSTSSQTVTAKPTPAATPGSDNSTSEPERAKAYFHAAMADVYEEEAVTTGRSEYVTHAIEEYKDALNADPNSAELNDGLAELYFRVPGHTRDAEATARNLLKTSPNDIDAHKLLGRIYLRQLSESQNAVSSTSPSGNALDQAIAEYEKIASLEPKNTEDRMILGQLYTVKHEPDKAEEQFKIARSIEPDSEEVVLNLARIYAENGNVEQAVKIIESVPESDRTGKMEFALGAAYDQLKRPKDAIAAYQRAADMDPDDTRSMGALAQALLNDDQLDAALKEYRAMAEAEPDDVSTLIHISEIQRRQGKYEDALATIQKASKNDLDNSNQLEIGYNKGLLLDVLGRYDEAAQTYEKMVEATSHANGAYTAEEKNNRGIFLARLGGVYHEQNKVDLAIATYQKMIDLGGDQALQGYQGEVDTYRDAKMFDKALEISQKAVAANPKNTDLKLMLAGELADEGKADEGLAMAKGLLDNSDKDRLVWLTLAQMDTRLHRWKDAEDALNKADPLSTKKDDKVYVLFLRGALAERQKHYEPAEQYFRQALALDPSNAMVLNYLGYMLADKSTKLTEALQMIRKAVEQEPMNGAYLDSLGWAYFKLGQYELAEENLRQAVERDQTDPTVHEHLGDLYEKTGRIRLAAAQWQLSLTEFAHSVPADVEPGDVSKVEKKLENARVKLAKEESVVGAPKPE
ncbi:MAG TPA: tetratricopeptide repeat protein [Terracidiphilus sp.]|nr:tetratricopeptide repeat protein [Terracidiphilus sp.]